MGVGVGGEGLSSNIVIQPVHYTSFNNSNNNTPSFQRGDKLVEYEGKTEKQLTKDEIKLPDGWLWKAGLAWTVDMNRGVDEEGKYMIVTY